jgi:hypothetical protein
MEWNQCLDVPKSYRAIPDCSFYLSPLESKKLYFNKEFFMRTFSELFTEINKLSSQIQSMLGTKISKINIAGTDISLGNIEFTGWDGEKEVTFALGNSSESLALFYPGASKGYGLCLTSEPVPKDPISQEFSNTAGSLGCTGQLDDLIARWENGEFGDTPVYVFTTKENVKDIAEIKGLKPRTDRAPFVLVSVTKPQLENLKQLGFETFRADNTEYLHRIALHTKDGAVNGVFQFPREVGKKPNPATHNAYLANAVKPQAAAAADANPGKAARVS